MPNKTSADGKFRGPVDVARKWTALEISIASIPADATVGVGRSEYDYEEENRMDGEERTVDAGTADVQEKTSAQSVTPPAEPAQERTADIAERAAQDERKRVLAINSLCREFGLEPDEYIEKKMSIEEVQARALEKVRSTNKPVSASVMQDEQDKFRAAMSDGLLMRSGLSIEKPAPGAAELRSMSLRDVAIDCLYREGITNAHRMQDDELMRQFFNPTSAFPSIMDMTIQKAYAQGYETVAVTFDKWTAKGSLKDFKETKGNYYLAGPAGEFLLVPEGGELKADLPGDQVLPKRKLNTYGRQFTMTRESFINDDIGFLTTLPSRYAASAKRTINKQVYDVLLNNPVIYDGMPLFGAHHKNTLDAGTGIVSSALMKMITKLQLQKDHFGQAIIIEPRFLITPIGYGFTLRSILGSPTLNTPENTQAVNPLYNYPLVSIEEPTLNATIKDGDNIPWYLVASQNAAASLQVDYLNGQEMPTIRRMEHPGQLGFVWDIYLDWGVNVIDFRGLMRNPGVPMAE